MTDTVPNVSVKPAGSGQGFEVWLQVDSSVAVVQQLPRRSTGDDPAVIGEGQTPLEALRDAEGLLEEALSNIRAMQAQERRRGGVTDSGVTERL